jgi:Gpi18-like mannosyltransferase
MAIFPVLPTVFLNSLFFGQSDAIYAAFAVGSVYFILAEKTWKSVLFLALSFMFKMQAMFLLPFFFVMMLKKQIKFYLFILIPIVYFLSILPAYLIGRPLSDLLNIYAMQASYYHKLTMNFPNLYVFINNDYYSIVKPVGLIITVVLTLIVGWYFGRNKEKMCFEDKIRLVFASAVIVPFILPGMHDRYLYLADSLGIVYFIVFRKKIYIPLGTLFISTYAYIRFFVHYPYFYLSPAVFVYILVIIWIIKDFDIPLYRFSRHRKKLHIINGAT